MNAEMLWTVYLSLHLSSRKKHDPIVDPRSAAIILDNIRSKEKEFFSVEMNRHGILRREGSQEVFEKIREFVEGAVR